MNLDALTTIGLTHFLVLSFVLATAGVAAILTKRSAIGILIGVELILNAAAMNLVAFNRYAWPGGDASPAIAGQMFAVFVIVLAAAEAAVALAIVLNYYNNFNSIDIQRADDPPG